MKKQLEKKIADLEESILQYFEFSRDELKTVKRGDWKWIRPKEASRFDPETLRQTADDIEHLERCRKQLQKMEGA